MITDDHLSNAIRIGRESIRTARPTIKERVATLYENHREDIYRFLVGHGLQPAKAQELAQDVFVNLFVSLTKGTEISSERAWLYSVAGKLAVDYWRREGRPMWVELDSMPTIAGNLRSTDMTPEASAVWRQRLQRVAAMMARLSKEQRLVIQLRLQGLRYRAIAEILGVSVSTTAEMLSTAVERLRSTAHE
jgi:RNA polymerase sigma-70 factor (ECF subfamily)